MSSACRIVMRFARLKELAEAPLVQFGEHLHGGHGEDLREVINDIRAVARNRAHVGWSPSKRFVGPVLGDGGEADQVYMSLQPLRGQGHGDTVTTLLRGGGVSEDALQAWMDNPTAASGNVTFGWDQSGFREAPKGDPRRKELQALGFDYKQGLAEALKELVANSGLREGDFIENSPLGAGYGDYRRALAYSRYGGFGPLNYRGSQHAIIGPGLTPMPFLQGKTNKAFAGERRWRAPDSGRNLTALEIDEIVGTLRQRLGIKDDAAFRPALDLVDLERDYFDSIENDRGNPLDPDYEPNPWLEPAVGAQLGIPGVASDLSRWETARLAEQQNEGIVQETPRVPRSYGNLSEYDYYNWHGESRSVIPGLRGLVGEAYAVPF